MLPKAKESTVMPSNSFVMSKFDVKQTKAQVFESSTSSSSSKSSKQIVTSPMSADNQNLNKMIHEEYMSKLNKLENRLVFNILDS